MEQYTTEELQDFKTVLINAAIRDVDMALALDKWIDRIEAELKDREFEASANDHQWLGNSQEY